MSVWIFSGNLCENKDFCQKNKTKQNKNKNKNKKQKQANKQTNLGTQDNILPILFLE